MISTERLQKALTYLAETDDSCAKAKALMIGLEHQLKTVKSVVFTKATGTMAEKDAAAYASKSYVDHVEKIQNATYDYETLRNKRLTEELIIEVWRSINSNRRHGVV